MYTKNSLLNQGPRKPSPTCSNHRQASSQSSQTSTESKIKSKIIYRYDNKTNEKRNIQENSIDQFTHQNSRKKIYPRISAQNKPNKNKTNDTHICKTGQDIHAKPPTQITIFVAEFFDVRTQRLGLSHCITVTHTHKKSTRRIRSLLGVGIYCILIGSHFRMATLGNSNVIAERNHIAQNYR